MRKILLAIAALVLFGMVSAGTVLVNDVAFDYSDTDIETAYVQLAYQDGILELIVADTAFEAGMPGLEVTVPESVGANYRGEDRLPQLEDLGAFELFKYGRDVIGFICTHNDAELDAIVADYLETFTAFGFEVELESDSLNAEVYLFHLGEETIRAVFSNTGPHVNAYLRFL